MTEKALNLRKIDPKLRQALHAEAKAKGMGLAEYCFEILTIRQQNKGTQNVIMPGPPQIVKAAEPQRDARGVAVILDDWTEPEAPRQAAPEQPKPKPECAHGWFNRSLCPECNPR